MPMLNPLVWEYSELSIFWEKLQYHNGIRAFSLHSKEESAPSVIFFLKTFLHSGT
jgi:hypothetical protein